MKKWMHQVTMLTCAVAIVAAIAGYCGYRQLMGDVRIVQYYAASADNLDWQFVRIRAIVPEDRYRAGWTENAMRIYAIVRSRNIPNQIDIAIYGSMEEFEGCEEYVEILFEQKLLFEAKKGER